MISSADEYRTATLHTIPFGGRKFITEVASATGEFLLSRNSAKPSNTRVDFGARRLTVMGSELDYTPMGRDGTEYAILDGPMPRRQMAALDDGEFASARTSLVDSRDPREKSRDRPHTPG
jgi:hypothetical protein